MQFFSFLYMLGFFLYIVEFSGTYLFLLIIFSLFLPIKKKNPVRFPLFIADGSGKRQLSTYNVLFVRLQGDFCNRILVNLVLCCIQKIFFKLNTLGLKSSLVIIRESELIDPPLNNASFTWSNLQAVPIRKRLDRFLFSNEWECAFPQSRQKALPRWASDHNTISLGTNPFKWGSTPFRFENM